jgi:hypothetical protein
MSLSFDAILRHLGDTGDEATSRTTAGTMTGDSERNRKATPRTTRATVAQASPSRNHAPVDESRPCRPCRPHRPEAGQFANSAAIDGGLIEDFRLVATWWEWTPDDIAFFNYWASTKPDIATAWIGIEAVKVRYYRDRLHCDNVIEFTTPPQGTPEGLKGGD